MRFRFIAQEAAQIPVSLLCKAMGGAELRLARGIMVGKKRVARIMRTRGIFGAHRRFRDADDHP